MRGKKRECGCYFLQMDTGGHTILDFKIRLHRNKQNDSLPLEFELMCLVPLLSWALDPVTQSSKKKNAPCLALHTLSLSQCRLRCCIAQHGSNAARRMFGDSSAQQLILTVRPMMACPLLAAVTERSGPPQKSVKTWNERKGMRACWHKL